MKIILTISNAILRSKLAITTKITEAWKASQDPDYPLKISKVKNAVDCVTTRAVTNGDVLEMGKTDLVQSTHLSDTSKAWNKTPEMIKKTARLCGLLKKQSKILCQTFRSDC